MHVFTVCLQLTQIDACVCSCLCPLVPVRSLTLFYSYHAEIAWTAIWLVFAIHL